LIVRAILVLLLATSYSPLAYGFGSSDVGTSGAVFLKIGPGARPAAMGEAFTGVADDIHSIYYNPAGLTSLRGPELTGMHMQWFQNVNYEFAAFAYPTKEHGTWGFAVSNLHTDDINRRTDDTEAPINQFGSSDNAYWLSYAYPITDKLSLGANTKYISQTLDSVNAHAYAVDGGLLYDTGWHGLRFGSSLQNLGTQVKFQTESDPLPLTIRLGASVQPIEKNLILSSDLILPRDHQVGVALGGEYHKMVREGLGYSIRSGYRSDTDVSGFAGVSAGGGLEFGRAGFDFAWVPFGELGNSYRYSLHLKFGPSAEDNKDHKVMQKAEDEFLPNLDFLNN
jgi:hypothetical protein